MKVLEELKNKLEKAEKDLEQILQDTEKATAAREETVVFTRENISQLGKKI